MAVVNLKGARIITGLDTVPAVLADPGEGGGKVRYWCETVEVGSADSATSTYEMARLPSNARICGSSVISWDDLASTGSPTLDIGVFNLSGASNITNDADALNDGLDAGVSAAASRTDVPVVKDIANRGKRLWEFVNGQTTDPKCLLSVKVSLLDADVNVGGTITLELYYTTD